MIVVPKVHKKSLILLTIHEFDYGRNSKNLGISRNVIAAYKEARGKYVASLNDDDMWNEDFLEKLVPQLEANPNLVLAFSDHYIINPESKIDDVATQENTQYWKRDQLKEGVYQPFYEIGLVQQAVPCAVATVIRKDAIEWNDFVPEMGPFWDLYLTYLACRTGGGAYYSPERLTRYRVHTESVTHLVAAKTPMIRFGRVKLVFFATVSLWKISDYKILRITSGRNGYTRIQLWLLAYCELKK
jgi:glycosyltransferase involved in cell wall biosynthesis